MKRTTCHRVVCISLCKSYRCKPEQKPLNVARPAVASFVPKKFSLNLIRSICYLEEDQREDSKIISYFKSRIIYQFMPSKKNLRLTRGVQVFYSSNWYCKLSWTEMTPGLPGILCLAESTIIGWVECNPFGLFSLSATMEFWSKVSARIMTNMHTLYGHLTSQNNYKGQTFAIIPWAVKLHVDWKPQCRRCLTRTISANSLITSPDPDCVVQLYLKHA